MMTPSKWLCMKARMDHEQRQVMEKRRKAAVVKFRRASPSCCSAVSHGGTS